MGIVWAVIISAILALILYGITVSKLKARRIRKATEKIFPCVGGHLEASKRYNIFLSHGKTLVNVKFVGISPAHDQSNPCLPFPLCQWLIVEKENGKRAYLKPETVKFYEDADERPCDQANKNT